MNKRKGMSQILVLIVAAAVLMMVGLLLISLSSGSITDTFSNTQRAACSAQADSYCQRNPSKSSIPDEELPDSCTESYSCSDGSATTGE